MERFPETLSNPSPELIMHERFTPWVAKHVLDYDGKIKELGYNPDQYPSQRLSEYKTPAVMLRDNSEANLDQDEVLQRLSFLFATNMGSKSVADSFIDDFNSRPALTGSPISYSELVVKYLDEGKKIGLVCDHAEDLGDIVKASGALGLAVAKNHGAKYIPQFNIWINKLMTRESYQDMPVEYLAGMVGNIRWAMPDTGTAEQYGFDQNDSLTKSINHATLRGYVGDLRTGTVEALVPGGSGMAANKSATGELESLSQKPTSAATAQLLGHMDALIPVCVWRNSWQIGETIILDDIKKLPKSQREDPVRQLVHSITTSMAQHTADLSGVPVHVG